MQLKQGTLLQGGKYKIVRVLGQGGFGITYLCEQTSLGRKVAIKEFFMKELCNRDEATSHVSVGSDGSRELVARFREKFVKEARLIASFDNSHIVRIHDIFEENGTAYYVMEYIDGGSLSSLLELKGGLPEEEVVMIIRQVGDALNYIHAQNVLHLDVKPSNILMRKNDEAVLVDFGISKRYDEIGSQTSSTPAGISKGYAPLEQYNQGLQNFSPATDVYSLGATLYRMVTGNVPPEASIVNEDGLPERPAGISASLWSAIEAAMQPRRKDRPQTISAWLDLLNNNIHAHVEEEPEVTIIAKEETKKPQASHPQPAPEPQPKPSNPKPVLCIIAAAVITLCILLFRGVGDDSVPPTQTLDKVDDTLTTETVEEPKPEPIVPSTNATTGMHRGHEWVDLGLPSGTKWATMNIGASSPSDYGNYYAWGETSTKNRYDWSTLRYRSSGDSYDNVKYSKYVTDSKYGNVDGKKELELSDDAVHVNWGNGWRMPTDAENDELCKKCEWTWTTQGGHKGYKVTGPNGNSIFLPAAGYRVGTDTSDLGEGGYYWSSTLCSSNSSLARYLSFDGGGHYAGNGYRRNGQSVRPVTE